MVTSIMWCVIKKWYEHPQSALGRGMQDDKSVTHELKSITTMQTISTQDMQYVLAYGGTIPFQQNVAYEQVHTLDIMMIIIISCSVFNYCCMYIITCVHMQYCLV